MRKLSLLVRRYGFDALIVVAAVAGVLGLLFRHDDPDAPTSPLWFSVPATVLIVLPLLLRRRFTFAAPATVWVLSPALSFVDGQLIPFTASISAVGLAAAFL
ncbi:MAG TPA: hypothetical protein VD769_12610, partial [Gaiellaceae bacterium]|nr:hypothetical protein [Gaiellaceae bacterium]